MDWRNRPKMFPIYMKNVRIRVWEHSARLLKEKGGENKSSELDQVRSIMSAETEVPRCRLELDFTPLTVHTTCSRSCFKYPNASKIFRNGIE